MMNMADSSPRQNTIVIIAEKLGGLPPSNGLGLSKLMIVPPDLDYARHSGNHV